MTSPALSPDPRTRARERFLEDLTLEERNLYESATLENIFYDASVSQKSHCAESTTFHLSSRIRPFVAAIDQYGHALDVLSNTYSLGMAPIWGSMRVLIKVREISNYTSATPVWHMEKPSAEYPTLLLPSDLLAIACV
jgi:hypothetical protein